MRSLSLKLTLAFLFVSLIGIIGALLIIQQRTRSEFDRFLFNQDKTDLVAALNQYYLENGSWQGVEVVLMQISRWQPAQEQQKTPQANPNERLPRIPFPMLIVDANGVMVFGDPDRVGLAVDPAKVEEGLALEVDGERVGWLLVEPNIPGRQFEAQERSFLGSVNQAVLISGIIAVVIASILGLTLARTLTRPIRELTNATQAVAQGELGYQVQVHSQDELGDLASSFNLMSEDLSKSIQSRRQMTADIAHDLGTPVSVILGYAEALSEGKLAGSPEIYNIIHQEAGHLSLLIEDLRLIALADAHELTLNVQSISPATLLERSAGAFNAQAQQKEISLQVVVGQNLENVKVDPERMAQILGNLVGNALRYTSPGGWIKLSARQEGKQIVVTVSDNGMGIAAEDLPFIFTRFYRGDKSRQANGEAGLGLTIAKALVEAQGGTIGVASEEGKGTIFTICLPVA